MAIFTIFIAEVDDVGVKLNPVLQLSEIQSIAHV